MITELTDATYSQAFAETEGGVCIFFKELCPHCKNMEKVMEKFAALEPGARLFRIDVEKNAAAAADQEAARAPTICILRDGAVVARKTGLMNPKELRALYQAGRGRA